MNWDAATVIWGTQLSVRLDSSISRKKMKLKQANKQTKVHTKKPRDSFTTVAVFHIILGKILLNAYKQGQTLTFPCFSQRTVECLGASTRASRVTESPSQHRTSCSGRVTTGTCSITLPKDVVRSNRRIPEGKARGHF